MMLDELLLRIQGLEARVLNLEHTVGELMQQSLEDHEGNGELS